MLRPDVSILVLKRALEPQNKWVVQSSPIIQKGGRSGCWLLPATVL
jgi:hypothetical protein